MKDFDIGFVVKLRSGGPNMTIVDRDGTDTVCSWIDHSGKRSPIVHTHRFPVSALAGVDHINKLYGVYHTNKLYK